jgi:hypothetical protein
VILGCAFRVISKRLADSRVSRKAAVWPADSRRCFCESCLQPNGAAASRRTGSVGDKEDFRRAAVAVPLVADGRAGERACRTSLCIGRL